MRTERVLINKLKKEVKNWNKKWKMKVNKQWAVNRDPRRKKRAMAAAKVKKKA